QARGPEMAFPKRCDCGHERPSQKPWKPTVPSRVSGASTAAGSSPGPWQKLPLPKHPPFAARARIVPPPSPVTTSQPSREILTIALGQFVPRSGRYNVAGKLDGQASSLVSKRLCEEPPQRLALRQEKWPIGLIAHFQRRIDAEAPVDGGSQVAGRNRIGGGISTDPVAGAVDQAAAD